MSVRPTRPTTRGSSRARVFGEEESRSSSRTRNSTTKSSPARKTAQSPSRPSSRLSTRPDSRLTTRPDSKLGARPDSRSTNRPASRLDSRPSSRQSSQTRSPSGPHTRNSTVLATSPSTELAEGVTRRSTRQSLQASSPQTLPTSVPSVVSNTKSRRSIDIASSTTSTPMKFRNSKDSFTPYTSPEAATLSHISEAASNAVVDAINTVDNGRKLSISEAEQAQLALAHDMKDSKITTTSTTSSTAPVLINGKFLGYYFVAFLFSFLAYLTVIISTSIHAKSTFAFFYSFLERTPLAHFFPPADVIAFAASSLTPLELSVVATIFFVFSTFALRHWAAITNGSTPAANRIVYVSSRGIFSVLTLALYTHFILNSDNISPFTNPHAAISLFIFTFAYEVQALLAHFSYSSIASKFYSIGMIILTSFHLFYDPAFLVSVSNVINKLAYIYREANFKTSSIWGTGDLAKIITVASADLPTIDSSSLLAESQIHPLWIDVIPAILTCAILSILTAAAETTALSTSKRSPFYKTLNTIALGSESLYIFFIVCNVIAVFSNRLQIIVSAGIFNSITDIFTKGISSLNPAIISHLFSLFVSTSITVLTSLLHFIDTKSAVIY